MKKIIFTLIMAVCASAVMFAAESVTLTPTADGFVRQSDDTYQGTYENMELTSYNINARELFLDFDLTDVTFTPEHATLKLYVNSVSNANPVIIAAYAKTGNAISESLTFTNRPTTDQYKTADIHASQDSVGKWLVFDFADFIKAQDFSVNKLVYFRIAIVYPPTTSGTSPLITIGGIESSNKPQLILNDAPVAGVYEVPFSSFESFTAPTSNTTNGKPEFAFNGAGLLPLMKHETAADKKSWRTANGTFPHHIIVKFQDSIDIYKLHIWNMNWLFGTGATDYTSRGVNGIEIYVSSSTDDLNSVSDFSDGRWKKVTPNGFSLTRATANSNYEGEDVLLTEATSVLWMGFKCLSNFESTSYAGLSEVKIYKTIPEEDPGPTTALDNRFSPSVSVVSEGGNLVINNIISGSRVALYNTQGQLINNEFAKSSSLQWNVSPGIYIVRVNDVTIKAVHR